MPQRYSDRYDDRDRDYDRDYDRGNDRDYYPPRRSPPRRSDRVYEEDLEYERERVERVDRRPARPASVISESRRAPRQPDFLREGYNQTSAGPLVVREEVREAEKEKEFERQTGKTNVSVIGSRRGGAPPPDRVVKEEIIVKDRLQERVRDDLSESGKSRRSTVSRAPRGDVVVDDRRSEIRGPPRDRGIRETEEEEIIIRKQERDYSPPPRPKQFAVEERDVYIRRGDSRPPYPRREVEEYLFRDREREREREISPPEVARQELVIREKDRESTPSRYEDEIIIRDREREREYERARPPPRMQSMGPPIAREREEFIFRRRRSPSPPPREIESEQIIIRRRERSPSPPPREPTPEPEPEPISVREPTPDLVVRPAIEQHVYIHHHYIDHGTERARSPTPPPPAPPSPPPALPPTKTHEESLEIEIRRKGTRDGRDFYEKDIIVDRERDVVDRKRGDLDIVRRRSVSSRPSHRDDVRRDSGRQLRRDQWTEVTKDLVIAEAIEKQNFKYKEGPDHYYITEYLEYEDVLKLVQLSEDIRKERRDRQRDAGWHKEDFDRVSLTGGGGRTKYAERERIHEHEHIVDHRDTRSVRSSRYR